MTKVFYCDWRDGAFVLVKTVCLEGKHDANASKDIAHPNKEVFSRLWSSGKIFFMTVAPSRGELPPRVPDYLRILDRVVLRWGRGEPLKEFGMDDVGVFAIRVFRREEHFVFIPWESVEMYSLSEDNFGDLK